MNSVLRASLNFHRNFSVFNGIFQKAVISKVEIPPGSIKQINLRALTTKSTCCHFLSTENSNAVYNPLISTLPACLSPYNSNLFSKQPAIGLYWQQKRNYKMKLYPKLRCKSCFFVYKQNRLFVECKVKPRHKQMEFKTKDQLWKEDYSKGNLKTAAFWKWSKEAWYRRGNNEWSRFDWLQGKYN